MLFDSYAILLGSHLFLKLLWMRWP